ncbi:MBL fold metallo-hydrolase [Candidatus Woesearchaeota archaeon]|nr:MBL fold metallo-hydrolase [Candidatus Woesearchaeota archaeon]
MKIIVLKQGVHADNYPESGPIKNHMKPICSTVTLIKADKNIIVDPGNVGFEDEILAELKKQGLEPEDIDIVICTHRHFDHVHNMHLFKNAIRVHNKEIHETNGNLIVYKEGPVDIDVLGIKLISTPGHMAEHVSVVVESEGKKTVIAGDAFVPEYLDLLDETGKKSALKIIDIADEIIPGHGDIIKKEEFDEIRRRLE